MNEKFPLTRFHQWLSNFEENPDLPTITRSALFTKTDLQDFLTKMEELDADSARVYFLRFRPNEDEPQVKAKNGHGETAKGCQWETVGKSGLSQVAIVLAPTKNYKVERGTYIVSADDITEGDSISLLIPGKKLEGPTGHNPPPPPPTGFGN